MKKLVIPIIFLFAALIFGISCQERGDLSLPVEGAPMTLNIKLESKESRVISRAASPEAEERRIDNIYIFIFNDDNTVSYREFFDNLNKYGSHTIQLERVSSGLGKQISVVANINTSMMCITSELLNTVSSKEELELLVCELNQDLIERGSNFMMSGSLTTDLIPGSVSTLIIPMNRVDSKIQFNILPGSNTYGEVSFKPRYWRVVNVPKKVRLFPTTECDLFNDSTNFFSSSWRIFEGEGASYGKTFAFYMLESRVTGKETIPSSGSAAERYAMREKQEKEPIIGESGKVENGDYIYAPEFGTYLQMTGTVSYMDGTTAIFSEATYTVHLGYLDSDPNDYMVDRNIEYIYNVTINSVDNIVVEVESDVGEEPQPGAKGHVIIADVIKNFDAHYETFSVSFNSDDIYDELSWNVITPFSDLIEGTDAKDYKWVYFRINRKTSNNYNDNLRKYPGDSLIYTVEVTLDTYRTDIGNGTTAETDKMLDVAQLIPILKECKTRKLAGRTDHLFDNSNNIKFTVYLNEFYYENHPITGESGGKDLWKQFVNRSERIMNILSTLRTSSDQKSTQSKAVFSFWQSSIQTIYNHESTQSFSAWGTQQKQDNNLYQFDKKSFLSSTNGLTYTSESNGRQNTLLMWGVSSTPYWRTYINGTAYNTSNTGTSLEMKSDYNSAKYRCMLRNRDNNGNGKIDPDEVRWYLASIDQLRGIWVGEPSLNPDSRLYDGSKPWAQGQDIWYASSTVPERVYNWIPAGQYDNPYVLWSIEGSSFGKLNGVEGIVTDEKVRYRCVRNLGLASNSAESVEPDDYATLNTSTNVIDLSRLNPTSIRSYTQTDELPLHHEREAYNRPYWSFEVYPGVHGSGYNWVQMRDYINGGNSLCPEGWRAPNQREMTLMINKFKNDGYWTQTYTMSRTRFQYNPSGGTRYGFAINATVKELFLINNITTETGGVRCVRDR